ncbi:MAG: hypothetical protein ACJA2S_004319 [Cyclobacteriaceae bacterium]
MPKHLSIFQKGQEVMDVVQRICDLIPEDNDMLMEVRSMMMFDAATIIRKSAMDLMVQKHALKMYGFEEVVYFDTVRELLEEYRLLFVDWVNGFDQWNYVIDRRGLFNP